MSVIKKTALWSFIVWILSACSDYNSEPEAMRPLTAYQVEVISYFKKIAIGFEYGTTSNLIRKWDTPMRIFVGGQKNNSLLTDELAKTITEINRLATDGFSIEVTEDTLQSNCYIFLGSSAEFLAKFPEAKASLGSNYGLFNVWYHHSKIERARIFVDVVRPTPYQQRSTLKEELTQCLGLGRDCQDYTKSIFYEAPGNGGFSTEYAEIDTDLIRLLYHPKMPAGLEEGFVNLVLIKILQNENDVN